MCDEPILQCIIVGDIKVGKSTLCSRYIDRQFRLSYQPTAAPDLREHRITIDDKTYSIEIWDTSGEKTRLSITRQYYRDADVAMIVYDITRRESFDNVARWLVDVRTCAPPDVVIALIGNKCDLQRERQVTEMEGNAFARGHGVLFFLETSAKTAKNVEKAFYDMVNRIHDGILPGPSYLIKYIIKYIIVGAQSVGKTALMLQFTKKIFRLQHESTVELGIGSQIVKIDDKQIKLQIFDTAGQERFNSLTRSYYRDAAAALIVYDVTDRETFKRLPRWLKEVRNNTSQNIAIMLVGNKIDLNDERQVGKSEGEVFARDNGLEFMEVSAKTAVKVERVFEQTAEEVYEKFQAGLLDVNIDPNTVNLGRTKNSNSKCWC